VTSASSGHRLLPHPADLMVEAWAPTRAGCLAEAARGMVESFALVSADAAGRQHQVRIDAAADERHLVDLLDEIIYLVDAEDAVPASIEVTEEPGGSVLADLGLVAADRVDTVGPVPKAVTWHGLSFVRDCDGWRCRVLVDV
jgi:SHS2 domain-containing protein